MSDPAARATTWSSATAYDGYMGRWSALVAPTFLRRLEVEPGRRWVDVGCGTGALTRAILAAAEPAAVIGIDPSEPFLDHARSATSDPRASFRTGTAEETGLDRGSADVVVSGLLLNNVPDVPAALLEARRIAVPGGLVATYVWDFANGMQFIRAFWDVAVAVDPAALAFDQGRRSEIAAPGPLHEAFAAAGLAGIAGDAIEIPTMFRDFEDFWQPFTRGTGHAPVYLASLDAGHRDTLRDALRDSVPIGPDGAIRLTARAWTCQGRTPA